MNEIVSKIPFNDDPSLFNVRGEEEREEMPLLRVDFKPITEARAIAITRALAFQLEHDEVLLKWFMELIAGFGVGASETQEGEDYHTMRAHHCLDAVFIQTQQGHNALAEYLLEFGIGEARDKNEKATPATAP